MKLEIPRHQRQRIALGNFAAEQGWSIKHRPDCFGAAQLLISERLYGPVRANAQFDRDGRLVGVNVDGSEWAGASSEDRDAALREWLVDNAPKAES